MTSAPQITIEDVVLNADNPWKKRINWNRLRCRLCDEVVLGKAIGSKKEWDRVRLHLRLRHGIYEDDVIPIRLLSGVHHRRWVRNRIKKMKGDKK